VLGPLLYGKDLPGIVHWNQGQSQIYGTLASGLLALIVTLYYSTAVRFSYCAEIYESKMFVALRKESEHCTQPITLNLQNFKLYLK